MSYTEKQFARLPKWAQVEITRLNNNLEYAERRVREVEGKDETNVFIDTMMDKIPLPKDSQICFKDETGAEYAVRAHRSAEQGRVGLHVSVLHCGERGFGVLGIFPHASNVVTIRGVRD